MYKTRGEASDYIEIFSSQAVAEEVEVVILAPFTCLCVFQEAGKKGRKLSYGAQNMFWQEEGAFTGEVSPLMLQDLGCTYVLLGHSERRQHLKETDAMVNMKVKAAFRNGLKPILCVGETWEEREKGKAFEVVKQQLKLDLEGIASVDTLTIAYEPVWAIGTGKNAKPDDAQEMSRFIRGCLEEMFGRDQAESTRVLYGGSVKVENIADFVKMRDIDGALVGGASLKPLEFAELINLAATAAKEK